MQQERSPRRSNANRTAETRAALIAAARELFVEKGYAETGTPEIVKTAGVTRGALYHHFDDKAALLHAVILAESEAVAAQIETGANRTTDSVLEAVLAGARAYFRAMTVPGRVRLLLREGPAVLGAGTMAQIDDGAGAASLRAGLAALMGEPEDLGAMVAVLSAGFDRAAADIASGADPDVYASALARLIAGLAQDGASA